MTNTSRRTVLSLAGVAALSGCTKIAVKGADEAAEGAKAGDDVAPTGASGGDDVANELSDGDEEPNGSEETDDEGIGTQYVPTTLVDDDVEIQFGSYHYWELNYSDLRDSDADHVRLEHEIMVRSGDSVDVLLFDADEFEYFSAGKRARYREKVSSLDVTRAEDSADLPFEDLVFVVNNTDRVGAEPTGPVEVSVGLTGTPEQ